MSAIALAAVEAAAVANPIANKGHLPVRKKLHAREGFCGQLARLRLLASRDPIERIQSFFGGPVDDVAGMYLVFSACCEGFYPATLISNL